MRHGHNPMKRTVLFIVILAFLASCAQQDIRATPAEGDGAARLPAEAVAPSPAGSSATSANPSAPTAAGDPAPTSTPVPAPTATLAPDAWMSMPVIPENVSRRMREIYQYGQELGNAPEVFTVIGDCGGSPGRFLGDFGMGPNYYSLGEDYAYLEQVIDHFHDAFGKQHVTVRDGFTVASTLSPLWADPALCQSDETPLACEVRINRPAFAFVILGTNDFNHKEAFEPNLRKVLDYLIAQGVVPILATKADNLEGDQAINAAIARLAYEYDIPLWNFWLAVQPLPGHGLLDDEAHLTWAGNHFDDPVRMRAAWPWRNLTALQTLDVVWRGVTVQP